MGGLWEGFLLLLASRFIGASRMYLFGATPIAPALWEAFLLVFASRFIWATPMYLEPQGVGSTDAYEEDDETAEIEGKIRKPKWSVDSIVKRKDLTHPHPSVELPKK